MIIRAIHPPNPYDYDSFELQEVQTYSILELLVPATPISEKVMKLPYHESYRYWVNPYHTVTYQDIVNLRH